MKQGGKSFFHVLYLDEERVDSVLAQIGTGLVTARTEEKGVSKSGGRSDIVGLSQILQATHENSSETGEYASSSKTISFHHAKILQLAHSLGIDLEEPRKKLPQHPDGTITLVSGVLTIKDVCSIRKKTELIQAMFDLAERRCIPGVDLDGLPEGMNGESVPAILKLFDHIPQAIHFSLELENGKTAGGTLDPRWFDTSRQNPDILCAKPLALKWLVLGYCSPKPSTPAQSNPFVNILDSFSELPAMIDITTPDIQVTPLVIMM